MHSFTERCKNWYRNQNSTARAFLWIALVLIMGIIIRWNYIISEITRGFEYLKK